MADVAVIAILLVGIPLIGWTTLHGWQTGTMNAAGVTYACYSRQRNPILFWFSTIFNVCILIGGVALLLKWIA